MIIIVECLSQKECDEYNEIWWNIIDIVIIIIFICVLDGTTGVYDIEELVALLERDKAKNVFVAKVPKEYAYVDYIVVVTGKSQKHMTSLATFVHKVYKLKRYSTDLIPKIEGQNSQDWIALDLGR